MVKKSIVILIMIIVILATCSISNAVDLKTSLDIVKKASETKELANDQGFISKTIVDSSAEKGEVTIEVKLANQSKTKETQENQETEIVLVIDNSLSMDFKTPTGETRKQIVLNSAKKLVESIFSTSSSVKVGIVKFHSSGGLWNITPAASTITSLSNNKQTVLDGLTKIEKGSTESGTDIQKGLIQAENMFTNSAKNKIIVLLTDGLPNEDAESNNVTDSKMVMTNETYLKILENTKKELLKIQENKITVISLMTGINSGDTENNGKTITSTEEDLKAVETIFGTQSKPTAGKFYNAKSTDTASIIENEITKEVTMILNSPLNTVKIVDYFPADITENFELSFVGKPSIGTANDMDTTSNTITWDIGSLKGDEVATLKYKLKIKDMKNTKLLNKTIATNEKIVLTYKDSETKDYTVELTSSPQIKLSEVKEKLIATVSYNPNTNTTGSVEATIKTNKVVNKVDGWKLSADGKTLTKSYSTNATETVHLVDLEQMTADVEVKISNIVAQNNNSSVDNTVATTILPQTGINPILLITGGITLIIVFALFIKYRGFKDIE